VSTRHSGVSLRPALSRYTANATNTMLPTDEASHTRSPSHRARHPSASDRSESQPPQSLMGSSSDGGLGLALPIEASDESLSPFKRSASDGQLAGNVSTCALLVGRPPAAPALCSALTLLRVPAAGALRAGGTARFAQQRSAGFVYKPSVRPVQEDLEDDFGAASFEHARLPGHTLPGWRDAQAPAVWDSVQHSALQSLQTPPDKRCPPGASPFAIANDRVLRRDESAAQSSRSEGAAPLGRRFVGVWASESGSAAATRDARGTEPWTSLRSEPSLSQARGSVSPGECDSDQGSRGGKQDLSNFMPASSGSISEADHWGGCATRSCFCDPRAEVLLRCCARAGRGACRWQ